MVTHSNCIYYWEGIQSQFHSILFNFNLPFQLCFSVALGFDNYVVIRHGVTVDGVIEKKEDVTSLRGLVNASQLGCYFCSDVSVEKREMMLMEVNLLLSGNCTGKFDGRENSRSTMYCGQTRIESSE